MFRNSAVFSPAAVIWIAIALAAAATAVSDRIKRVLGLWDSQEGETHLGCQEGRFVWKPFLLLSLGKLLPVSLPPSALMTLRDPNGFSVSQPDCNNGKATSRQRVG